MRIPSNKISDIRRFMQRELEGLYDRHAIDILATVVLEVFAGMDKATIYSSGDKAVTESVLLKINNAIKRLKNEEPIEYITGYAEFYGLRFKVTPDVLIPRPETEELVKHVFNLFRYNPCTVNILDACTGSGCIAVTLKKVLPRAQMYAFDSSHKAIEIAALNAASNETVVSFFMDDLLNYTGSTPLPLLDALVCNPPYVKASEKDLMKRNVLDYEPHSALFVPDNNPLVFYKALAELGKNYLRKGALLVSEINESLGSETVQLFAGNGYKDVALIKDMNNKDRFVKAVKSSE